MPPTCSIRAMALTAWSNHIGPYEMPSALGAGSKGEYSSYVHRFERGFVRAS